MPHMANLPWMTMMILMPAIVYFSINNLFFHFNSSKLDNNKMTAKKMTYNKWPW